MTSQEEQPRTFSAFADFRRHLATGSDLAEVVKAAREAYKEPSTQTVVVFDDKTGDRTEIDPREDAELPPAWQEHLATRRAGPGRPKLGVVSREVSLLPRHWEWLNGQQGGASAAIRRLVDEARRARQHEDRLREAKDAAYRFMTVVGGDFSNFEEATRALYADRLSEARELIGGWPEDLRAHALRLFDAVDAALVSVSAAT